MPDIIHRIGTRAALHDVYQAVATIDGLAGWWTTGTSGESRAGGVISFRFGAGSFEMRVLEQEPDTRVRWQVLEGPPDWIGSIIHWDLKREGEYTILLLRHAGWKEATESMAHCSTKWAIFLMSLKALVETGSGLPDPRDVKIDNWN